MPQTYSFYTPVSPAGPAVYSAPAECFFLSFSKNVAVKVKLLVH